MQIGKTANTTNFDACTESYKFASANGQRFKFHNIIWAKTANTPDWVYDGKTADELEQWMYSYVDEIHENFEYRADYIDVINEMVADTKNDTYHDSPWLQIDDFACKLFKYTKSKFPNADLLYNDYSFESVT
jgi:GH35 family endo-1,4-beta-xylanase